jgi:hypothetical protein
MNEKIEINNIQYNRILVGSFKERHDDSTETVLEDVRCRECGKKRYEHHELNCSLEICPKCRKKLISCDCDFDWV